MAKSVKGTQTEKNLLTSFAGESQARMRYTYFASTAKKEGYEREHIVVWLLESHAIGFKLCREVVDEVGWEENNAATAIAFIESCLYRVGKA